MTAATGTYSNPSSSSAAEILIVLAVLVLVAVGLVASHAIERHGADAVAVRQCLDNGGQVAQYINPMTGNTLRVCRFEDGRYGVQVCKAAGGCDSDFMYEVTAFVKNKMRDWTDVVRYLENSGAVRVWSNLP